MHGTKVRGRQKKIVARTHRWLPLVMQTARQIADEFQPDKIIVFGSVANDTAHIDSDVDLLVIMPTRNPVKTACDIRLAVEHPYPMDLLVRDPKQVSSRIDAGDSFLKEIVTQGVVLYEKTHS